MRFRHVMTAATTVLAAVSLSGAAAAQPAAAKAPANQSCSDLGNGTLCATGIPGSPAGYDAAYAKRAGSTRTVRFALRCANGRVWWDNGRFTIAAGQRESFVVSIGDWGSCRVEMHDYTSGDQLFVTNYVNP